MINYPATNQISQIILVSAGKGGVGKSTVAANLTAGLHMRGFQVGILDADVYGPSQGIMWNMTSDLPVKVDESGVYFVPHETNQGVKFMSMSTRIAKDQAVNWKGPVATLMLQQMFFQTLWGKLDYLIVDLPPGTGDIHLWICDRVKNAQAIVVTTPQAVSVLDCQKGIDLFRQAGIAILGVVENMSYYVCACCGHQEHLFGESGGQQLCLQFNLDLISQIPMMSQLRLQADQGIPWMLSDRAHVTTAYERVVDHIIGATNATTSHGKTDSC